MTGETSVEHIESPPLHPRFLSPLRISDRRAILMGMDLVAVNLALVFALSSRVTWPAATGTLREHPQWFALLTGIWLMAAYSFDLYRPRVARRLGACVPATLKTGAVAAAVYLLIPYVTPPLPSSRLPLVSFPVFVTAAVLIWRSAYIFTLPQPFLRQRVLVLGAGSAGRLIARTLAEEAGPDYQLVGFVDDTRQPGSFVVLEERQQAPVAGGQSLPRSVRLPVLGGHDCLTEVIAQHRVTTLVLSVPRQVESRLLQALMGCAEGGVEVVPMAALYEQLTGRVPVEHLQENWYVALPVHHRGHSPLWRFTKRFIDIALASLGLLVLMAVLPAIAVVMRLDSPGPLFYEQRRVGKGGRLFHLYKLRTMKVNAENGAALWAQRNDPRATRLGRLLRATHVDEFPQFLNILRGEMSAVGPRPERPEFVSALAATLPFYPLRHAVKPGMAGWALVKQGYAGTPEDALIRLQYDFYYIKHQSLWFDAVILLKTFGHALTFKGW